ncbi:hypothetical protein AAZX31_19G051100 [Glycine max]|uniref:NAC domain-containing protein n=1 Tax=Glycine max TaxID=3847 RepID=K7MWS8_SOYBN|nr:SUPPRESSOR OF GAMMA RESPONSE 1 [Glycine max]XP_028216994.1 SUPPRESSOR OF GAMMA RESPONSE 1-like [Glycine soja]KAG4912046.1 hypothetical protein JHK86_052479 [Glycine max]KAG5082479.1 hypothetical protein JHK84_052517 [Glycine max]KAG5085234.1 hypothetical protein JHK82_052631 [Glycine max]KAH1076557.1 hypothetical protein GYH30_052164 [Glycine max]KAH1193440.1 SUPPRESSOR OF GAMMA RESPONSE 1 [Glycine max]|eukprot:XP_006604012.1 SUPPRESSOR OF GAMMA RESPONSE 1 [Glycine max]
MARSWLIDIGGFAKKVKSTTLSSADQIKDCGAYRECPNCSYHIDNSDVSTEWPGFPLGVKFDPSDVELLEHLAAKCGIGNTQQHMFINEFIPTLEGDQGICYTHPENLPGAKKDGSYVHFFHRTTNAYATGQRKRRKIHHQQGLTEEHVRWHKTGKTKAIIEDGAHKGFKKIMVLYVRSSENGSRSYKSNWVMHQYHLGTVEEEKEGEYVVSKIFCQQQKQTEKNEGNPMAEDPDNIISRTGPRTPKPNPPNPPRAGKSVDCDDNIDETVLLSSALDTKTIPGESHAPQSDIQDQDFTGNAAWLAGESQAEESTKYDGCDDILLCKEILDSSAILNDPGLDSTNLEDIAGYATQRARNDNESCGISVLDSLELDTPDFDLSSLYFCSQDSILDWMDRL